MSRTELQKLDQSKIEDFRNMINLAKSSAKQAGNAVTVDVVEQIGKRLRNDYN